MRETIAQFPKDKRGHPSNPTKINPSRKGNGSNSRNKLLGNSRETCTTCHNRGKRDWGDPIRGPMGTEYQTTLEWGGIKPKTHQRITPHGNYHQRERQKGQHLTIAREGIWGANWGRSGNSAKMSRAPKDPGTPEIPD